MNLTVIGLGLIGGSLALDLRAKGFVSHVTGVDLSEENGRLALSRGLVDQVLPLPEALAGAQLVVLAIPVDAIAGLLPKILDQIGDDVTVTDMGSTKKLICAAVAQHPRRAQYVASHPMSGTEHSGPLAAVRDLFAGRAAVICEAELSAPHHLRRIDELYDALKVRKVYMSAEDHDLHTAYISHLSHAISFVLANTVLDKEKDVSTIFDLAGGGFESTARLAKSSSSMWLPIFQHNREHVTAALDAYIERLQQFRHSLQNEKFTDTEAQMAHANQIRRVLQTIGHRANPATSEKPR